VVECVHHDALGAHAKAGHPSRRYPSPYVPTVTISVCRPCRLPFSVHKITKYAYSCFYKLMQLSWYAMLPSKGICRYKSSELSVPYSYHYFCVQ
jgi:hypothetical protein